MNQIQRTIILAAFAAVPPWALAHTTVKDAWVRATVAEQKASGAFMSITSEHGGKLVSAASPVAGVVEVHEMAMSGNVMKMHAIPELALPAGQAVKLEPGGYHVMLMDLKQQLKEGEVVPLTLVVEARTASARRSTSRRPSRRSARAIR